MRKVEIFVISENICFFVELSNPSSGIPCWQ